MRTVNDKTGEVTYGVHEIYVNAETNDQMWTLDPVPVEGDSFTEVKTILLQMLRDIDKYEILDVQ